MTIIPFIVRWGFDAIPWPTYLDMVANAGFRGIEMGAQETPEETRKIMDMAKARGLLIILQHWDTADSDFEKHRQAYVERLKALVESQPLQVNSHSGRDIFSVAQNSELIALAATIEKESGVPICHETHRGRFLYGAHRVADYIAMKPALTLDIAHWVLVAESYLDDQQATLESVYPLVQQIHARVGHTQASQIHSLQHPTASAVISTHFTFWHKVIEANKHSRKTMPIVFEMGPPPYMPSWPDGQSPQHWQFHLNQQLAEAFFQSLEAIDGIKVQQFS